jgi:hypothetical protein
MAYANSFGQNIAPPHILFLPDHNIRQAPFQPVWLKITAPFQGGREADTCMTALK